jgi:hypothetical protein
MFQMFQSFTTMRIAGQFHAEEIPHNVKRLRTIDQVFEALTGA